LADITRLYDVIGQKITKRTFSAVKNKNITRLPLSYLAQIHLVLRSRLSLVSMFICDAFYLFWFDGPVDLIYKHIYVKDSAGETKTFILDFSEKMSIGN
jgi:hypothetical protein